MVKYIRVIEKIDDVNKKIILRFDKCNDCPLMIYKESEVSACCRKFSNGKDKVINYFILQYQNEELETINVPEWCGLCNNLNDLEDSKSTFLITEDSIKVSLNNNEKNLPIYNISYFKNIIKGKKGTTNIIPMTILANTLNSTTKSIDEEEDDFYNCDNPFDLSGGDYVVSGNDYTPITHVVIPKVEMCSLCSCFDESVDRLLNNGMCSSCTEKYRTDEQKLKESFIRNFRLKRGVKNINSNFKLVK